MDYELLKINSIKKKFVFSFYLFSSNQYCMHCVYIFIVYLVFVFEIFVLVRTKLKRLHRHSVFVLRGFFLDAPVVQKTLLQHHSSVQWIHEQAAKHSKVKLNNNLTFSVFK